MVPRSRGRMGMRHFRFERELAACMTTYLEGCRATVYPEVAVPGYEEFPDLVAIWRQGAGRMPSGLAIHENEVWVVETKLHLGLDILAQAMAWTGRVHRTWIAVPAVEHETAAWQLGVRMAEHGGIGLFVVLPSRVRVDVQARVTAAPSGAGLFDGLGPAHQTYAVAGTCGARRLTPWTQTTDALAALVAQDPGRRVKDYTASLRHHYRSTDIATYVLRRQASDGAIAGVEARRIGGVWRLYPAERA